MGFESPIVDFLESLGAHRGERRGRSILVHFGDPSWEYEAVRRSAGIVDRSDLGAVRIAGADRVRFLENMLTSDVKGLTPGQGRLSALLTPKGKFIALFRLLAFAEHFVALLDREAAPLLASGLAPFAVLEEVEVADESDRTGIVHVVGPESTRLLASVSGSPLPHVPPLSHRPIALPGIHGPVHTVKECVTGEDGFDLLVPSEQLVDAWKVLLRHETPKPQPVGADAFEILRMEAGSVLFGPDVGPDLGPIEAGLESALSFDKGCYPGQEVVAKTHYRGKPPKRLVGLLIEGNHVPESGSPVIAGGEEAGRITSAVRARNPEGIVAFAVVRTQAIDRDDRLSVRSGERILPARTAELPFR